MKPPTSALLPYTCRVAQDIRLYSTGHGAYLFTHDGRKVLDGLSGSMNANLGHGNSAVAAAMHDQAMNLTALPSIAGEISENCIVLSQRLREFLGLPDATCLFTSSGSEATEAALAITWKYWSNVGQPKKTRFLSLDGSYHGCTFGALSITGRTDEHTDIPYTTNLRLALPSWSVDDPHRVSRALKQIIASDGAEAIAAIILEPIMGLAGMLAAAQDDIREVVKICQENDILVVLDEALTGLGRVGYRTAAEFYGIEHDLLLISKGLGCGFIPIAVTCISPKISLVLQRSSPELRHGHTSSGNAMATRVALTVLDELIAADAIVNARRMEAMFKEQMTIGLSDLQWNYAIRATGLCLALQTENPAFAQQIGHTAFDLGLRVRAIDHNIIACPPLVITETELTELTTLLLRALAIAERLHTPRAGR